MKSHPTLALLVFGLGALLAGCNASVKPDSVMVTVAELKAADSAAPGNRVVMTVRFASESLNAFGFSGSSHKLYLNGTFVGRAVSSTPIGLPPLSTTTQDISLVVENAAFLKHLLALPGEPAAKYRLESVLFTTAGEDEMRVKGSSEGMVDLRGLHATSP